jgi:hypothetical protein
MNIPDNEVERFILNVFKKKRIKTGQNLIIDIIIAELNKSPFKLNDLQAAIVNLLGEKLINIEGKKIYLTEFGAKAIESLMLEQIKASDF